MATNIEQWLAFRTPESGTQVIAALEWNISDCDETMLARGDMLTLSEHDAIIKRRHEAIDNLELARKQLAKVMEAKAK